MIVGHGVDVVDIGRIQKFLSVDADDFLHGTFTRAERETESQEHDRAEFLAGRLAAKEAVVKALGTGFTGDISWQQVEIVRKESGQPTVQLSGAARAAAETLGANRWLVSISHTETVAFASAIAIQD
jgi:holo-[acyl-carrier protein] synthase